MTSDRLTAIERAFELAKSGDCANVAELRKQLRSEGYPEYHLVGPSLSRQLEGAFDSGQPVTGHPDQTRKLGFRSAGRA